MRNILYVAAAIAFCFFTSKVYEKYCTIKYRNVFKMLAYTIVDDISAHTQCSRSSLLIRVDDNIVSCHEKRGRQDLQFAYDAGNVVVFTYLSALEYVSQFVPDDYERTAVEDHCKISKSVLQTSYDPIGRNQYLKKYESSTSNLVGFAIGIVILAIVFTFSGCTPQTKPEQQIVETTSRGTAITDSVSLDDVDMIETPDSDCFSAIGYKSGMLIVTFRDSGASYSYWGVPEEKWNELRRSTSPGSYYNKEIKGIYACEKVE